MAAVGKGGSGNVLYPAAYEQVIGVGAVTEDYARSLFSRKGSEVGLVVSGSAIRSTWPDSQYELSNGMSMTTPFVTGTIELLLESDEHA